MVLLFPREIQHGGACHIFSVIVLTSQTSHRATANRASRSRSRASRARLRRPCLTPNFYQQPRGQGRTASCLSSTAPSRRGSDNATPSSCAPQSNPRQRPGAEKGRLWPSRSSQVFSETSLIRDCFRSSINLSRHASNLGKPLACFVNSHRAAVELILFPASKFQTH